MEDFINIFFSNNQKMEEISKILRDIAQTDINVLIHGESGVGKEVVAQALHQYSHRCDKPFVKVNCAAIPAELLESELMGFEKGAFTGADTQKPGKFELANRGTILLNEIGAIDISIQAKLLQVLQNGVFPRIGGEEEVEVNVSVVCTTKENLEELVAKKLFRQDLFYRINVINIFVPSLRERREQIIPLSRYIFNHYKIKYGKNISSISSKMEKRLKEYSWPGNIQELRNIIKRIVIFGEDISPLFISDEKGVGINKTVELNTKEPEPNPSDDRPVYFNLKEISKAAVQQAEKKFIIKTLKHTNWNRKKAALLLDISYKTLLNKIKEYNLTDNADNIQVTQ